MVREEHRLTETDSADVGPIFADVEQTDSLYHEVVDKLRIVAPCTT